MLRKLNPEQEDIVSSDLDSPILVYAGPGSGKTEAIAHRIIRIITEYPEDKFLVLTFTKKASHNIRKRVVRCLADKNIILSEKFNLQDHIKTFHKFTYLYGKNHKAKINNKKITVSNPFEIKKLMKDFVARQEWGLRLADPRVMEEIFSILTLMQLESYRENLQPISPENLAIQKSEWINKKLKATPALYGLNEGMCKEIFNTHKTLLKRHCYIDHQETLTFCRDLFRDNVEKCKKESAKYKHILIDEFQDINIIQFEIVALMTHAREDNFSIFCVGDPDQSIFGFSGGTPRVFNLFLNQFKNSKAMPLSQNYRSTKKIVNLSTKFIANKDTKKQYFKPLFTENPEGQDVVFCESINAKAEAQLLIQCAKELIKNNPKIEILFLYRNRQESKEIKKILNDKHIKFLDLSREFFQLNADVLAIIHYVKYFYEFKSGDPNYQSHISSFYGKPANGLGAKAWELIVSISEQEQKTIKEVLAESENYPELANKKIWFNGTKSLLAHLEKIENMKEAPILSLMKKAFKLTGLKDKWEADISSSSSSWNLNNVNQYMTVLEDLKSTFPEIEDKKLLSKSTESFQDKLFENEAIINIYLSTIHNCKGLEYDAVFLTNLIDGLLPYKSSLSDEVTLLEEANLTYVAMTRAKILLYLSTYKFDASKKQLKTSRYYEEMKEIYRSDESNILEVTGTEFVGLTEEALLHNPIKEAKVVGKRKSRSKKNKELIVEDSPTLSTPKEEKIDLPNLMIDEPKYDDNSTEALESSMVEQTMNLSEPEKPSIPHPQTNLEDLSFVESTIVNPPNFQELQQPEAEIKTQSASQKHAPWYKKFWKKVSGK